jgi:hypothetical protein
MIILVSYICLDAFYSVKGFTTSIVDNLPAQYLAWFSMYICATLSPYHVYYVKTRDDSIEFKNMVKHSKH